MPRLFLRLLLVAALFAPAPFFAQIGDPIRQEDRRIFYGGESADTTGLSAAGRPCVPADTAKAVLRVHQATLLLFAKKFAEARTAAEEAIAVFACIGIETPKTISAWDVLIKVNYFTENYREALRAVETKEAICRRMYPENHPGIAGSYNDRGLLYNILGEQDKALEWYIKACETTSKLPDPCANTAFTVYSNIGNLYMAKEQCAQALEFYEKAVQAAIQCKLENTWAMISLYSNLGSAYGCLGQVYKQIEYLEKGAAFVERYGMPFSLDHLENLAACLNNLGTAYNTIGRLEQSITTHRKALAIQLKAWPSKHIEISNSYNFIASLLVTKGDLKNATWYAEMAIATLAKSAQGDMYKMADYFSTLGNCRKNMGDHQKAIELHEHALALRLKMLGPDHPVLSTSYYNLARALTDAGEYDLALRYFDLAVATFVKTHGEVRYDVAMFYNSIGVVHAKQGDQKQAAEYYRKALAIMEQVFVDDHPKMISMLCNLGDTYLPGGNLEAAAGHIRRSIALSARFYGPNSANLASGYTALGALYEKAGRPAEAEGAFQAALTALDGDTLDAANTAGQRVFTHLAAANFFQKRYRKTLGPGLLENSRHHYAQALDALNRLSRSVSPASKSTLAAQAADICAGGIATYLLLQTRADSFHAFDFAERSKAYVLLEAMKDADALHIAGIPDSLLEHERNLRLEIVFFEKRQQELRDSLLQKADTVLASLGGALLDLKSRHETLIRFFEEKYPEYHRAKYGLSTTSVTDVQKMLRPGQTLLEYSIGDSAIFAFIVQPDHFSVHALPRDFPLEQTVDSLTRLGIYAYYTLPKEKRPPSLEKSSVQNYTRAARQLYQKLVAPVAEHLTEELIVIPDGVLGYVPFETLLTGDTVRLGVFATYEPYFLLQRHRISYGASATLLREMCEKRHREQAQEPVLALAPFFRGDTATLLARLDSTDLFALRDAFEPLKYSGEEAGSVARLLGGSALYGTGASLDLFRQRAPRCRVLHLSTHGKADDRAGDYAFLALGVPGDSTAFDKLYARDLYALELNADLVVLSACETAIGKLRRGEGIVSLARAFSFAGAKSLVTSLWKVDDAATRDVVVDFYRNLRQGSAKDAALRQAKLDFLKNNRAADGGARLHPFFWAGLVAVGDVRAMK